MPQRSKGPRLYLRTDPDEKPVWIIRDGRNRVSTGFGPLDSERAQKALAEYIAQKYEPPRERGRDPDQVRVADLVAMYSAEAGLTVKSPKDLQQRMLAILGHFGRMRVSEVTGPECRAYAMERGSASMARRELEDLRAAINLHHRRGLLSAPVSVMLPPKAQPRERWLTRPEAAKLLWAAWRYREVQKGRPTGRRSRQHVARFILTGLYTGTRSGAICGAALTKAIGRGYVDLDAGLFYRKALGVAETKKRQPTIRIPDRLLAHMRRWARLGISRSAVIEFNGESVKSVRKAFARAAQDAGLENVSPHILRHTAVTWAMQNRADIYDAADFFGMSVEMLERVYGHHHPDQHKGVGDAVTRRSR
jgi:integrase